MPLYTNWTEGTVYNFSPINSPQLPRTYTGLKLIGIGTFEVARMFAATSLVVQWRTVYPSLPVGTPDDPAASRWLIFESSSGERIPMSAYWIDGGSVVPQTFTQASVLITETSTEDIAILRDFMNRRNMKYSIEFLQA